MFSIYINTELTLHRQSLRGSFHPYLQENCCDLWALAPPQLYWFKAVSGLPSNQICKTANLKLSAQAKTPKQTHIKVVEGKHYFKPNYFTDTRLNINPSNSWFDTIKGILIFTEKRDCNEFLLMGSGSGNVLNWLWWCVIFNVELCVQTCAVKSLLPAMPSLLARVAAEMWCSNMLLLDVQSPFLVLNYSWLGSVNRYIWSHFTCFLPCLSSCI